MNADEGWETILQSEGVTWAMIRPSAPLAGRLRASSGWMLAFEDSTAIVSVRKQE
jgi:hypothetical protein